MIILDSIITTALRWRMSRIEAFMQNPIQTQNDLLTGLLSDARNTEFGKKYDFGSIKTYEQFRNTVPVSTYEQLFPYIDRVFKGEQNILWPSEITKFAKSSGTTNARSKLIPVSDESLEETHMKASKDLVTIYVNNNPDNKVFSGKNLSIGGSIYAHPDNPNAYFGDVSAVITKNLPFWAEWARTPSIDVAMMENWEQKIEKMAHETAQENVITISGIPTWTILLLQRILEITNADNMLEIWPEFEVFNHGAVSFEPYRELFKNMFPSDKVCYTETYNATEGFFGVQDRLNEEGMLLLLEHGIFYEFIPMEELGNEYPKAIPLEKVELGKNYALVISTNAGLWRYLIGDTIRFTTIAPYRIKVTGRTKHFINAFGEEVIIENAESAISQAAFITGAIVSNYTAGPVYIGDGKKGGHEWLVEFDKEPDSLEKFTAVLDETLREVNSDYDAKRANNLALVKPLVGSLPRGTFYSWLKSKSKLGGQNKIPRLSNDRIVIGEIKELLK
jgi:hypothetical protein